MSGVRADAIVGCIVGGAIGDAAGAALEGLTGRPEPRTLGNTVWHLTDDTQLTLATCEALVECGTPDPERIAALATIAMTVHSAGPSTVFAKARVLKTEPEHMTGFGSTKMTTADAVLEAYA